MLLESETNAVETFKEAARNFAALADAVSEQIRPAMKVAVDAADGFASSIGTGNASTSTSPIAEARMARESLDEASQNLGALIDTVGDQVRPAIKFAFDTSDAVAEAIGSARAALDRLLTSLGADRIERRVAVA